MIHHNGNRFIPMYEGIVTIADIDYLIDSAQVMKRLPDEMIFQGPSNQCEWVSGLKGKCWGRDGYSLGPFQSKSFFLMVMEQETSILDYSPIRSLLVRLSMQINNRTYEVPMQYSVGDCELSWK